MSQHLPFERVKNINQRYVDIICGYTRKCQCLLPSNETYYQIHKSIQYSILLFFYTSIESKILTDKETDKLLSMFDQQNKFKELDAGYSCNLLYASYRDGIGEKIFKDICHDRAHLLCLISTKKGNVYGGYTSKGWRGKAGSEGQHDDKAFLFNIRSSKNYPPRIFNVVNASKALWNQRGYYCMFGSSCVYFIYGNGKIGRTYDGTTLQDSEYESIPNDDYITGHEGDFDVDMVEVFQLRSLTIWVPQFE